MTLTIVLFTALFALLIFALHEEGSLWFSFWYKKASVCAIAAKSNILL